MIRITKIKDKKSNKENPTRSSTSRFSWSLHPSMSTGSGVHLRHSSGSNSEKRDIKLTMLSTSKHLNLGARDIVCIRNDRSFEQTVLKQAPINPPKHPTTTKSANSHTE